MLKISWNSLPDYITLLDRRQRGEVFAVNLDLSDWVACPLIMTAVQTNGFDCGIWVLAMIAATLQGCHRTALEEREISEFRRYLHTLVITIPSM